MEDWVLISDPCPECEFGSIYAVRNKKNNKLCAYCEECDTLWKNPDDVKRGYFFEDSDREFVWGGYATLEEVIAFGWKKYIRWNFKFRAEFYSALFLKFYKGAKSEKMTDFAPFLYDKMSVQNLKQKNF